MKSENFLSRKKGREKMELISGVGLVLMGFLAAWSWTLHIHVRKVRAEYKLMRLEMERWEKALSDSCKTNDDDVQRTLRQLESKMNEMHGKLFK